MGYVYEWDMTEKIRRLTLTGVLHLISSESSLSDHSHRLNGPELSRLTIPACDGPFFVGYFVVGVAEFLQFP